jgi:hypothetical protein
MYIPSWYSLSLYGPCLSVLPWPCETHVKSIVTPAAASAVSPSSSCASLRAVSRLESISYIIYVSYLCVCGGGGRVCVCVCVCVYTGAGNVAGSGHIPKVGVGIFVRTSLLQQQSLRGQTNLQARGRCTCVRDAVHGVERAQRPVRCRACILRQRKQACKHADRPRFPCACCVCVCMRVCSCTHTH